MKPYLILSFDTTGLQDSIALGIGSQSHDEIDAQTFPQGGSQRQSSFLITDLQTLLKKHHADFQDITILCTLTGPGSFTGIRIGLAAAQGFLIANRCQIFAPSTLDLLLFIADQAISSEDKPILALVDTKRGDYYALKKSTGHPNQIPVIVTKEEAIEFVRQGGLLISSTDISFDEAIPVLTPLKPLASYLIEYCRHHIASHPNSDAFRDLSPCYIRNPEFTKKKSASLKS